MHRRRYGCLLNQLRGAAQENSRKLPLPLFLFSLDSSSQWVERVRVWLQQNRAPVFDALRALDTDADGYISVEQATEGLTKLRAPMTSEELETYLQALDLEGDKRIHYCMAPKALKFYAGGFQELSDRAMDRVMLAHRQEIAEIDKKHAEVLAGIKASSTKPAKKGKKGTKKKKKADGVDAGDDDAAAAGDDGAGEDAGGEDDDEDAGDVDDDGGDGAGDDDDVGGDDDDGGDDAGEDEGDGDDDVGGDDDGDGDDDAGGEDDAGGDDDDGGDDDGGAGDGEGGDNDDDAGDDED
eukprot:m.113762 g.113762  ORF g.113762 m.113762 type:complete len:295 (+) comp9429_c0_seq1:157-1041(+)